jgi:glycosyltransferase involved in cell wall biosynthesis
MAEAERTAPEIAVVIPTRARETRLAFALEALARQTIGPDRFEVVVVRDADASEPVARAPEGLDVSFLRLEGIAGPTAKRNLGWRSSRAALVAFTDDDCRPRPDWLERLLAGASGGETFVQGRTEVDPDERQLLFGLARSKEVVGPSEWFETCNMAYPRALLERLGGFDESFSFGGEDTDLGRRALAAGAERIYASDAVVFHAVLCAPLARTLREAGRWQTLPLVVARHPEQRRFLFLRFFRNRSHFGIVLAALGLLGARRRPRAALAAGLPYLLMNTNAESVRNPRAAARHGIHLPARAALDAVQTAATIRQAVRCRVPMA